MTNCNYTVCRHNAASSPRLKRYGSKCMSTACIYENYRVSCILHNSAGDVNYNVERLTDDELKYCLFKENRKTGQANLRPKPSAGKKRKEGEFNESSF